MSDGWITFKHKNVFIKIQFSGRSETGLLGGGEKKQEEFVQIFGLVGGSHWYIIYISFDTLKGKAPGELEADALRKKFSFRTQRRQTSELAHQTQKPSSI